jgi:glycosyltransferase involved in cell wall biosynthesis
MQPMAKPRIAILHYSAPPIIGGVESTIAVHARLLADHAYPVKIIAGRGGEFDSRVPVEIIPAADSRDTRVLEVNRALKSGTVTGEFHSLVASLKHALADVLKGVDICIVHNALTLHKNLALTGGLREIAARNRTHLIAWCHDFAWADRVYAKDMHAGPPWDWLRQRWEGVRYVVVSEARRKELARLLEMPEPEIEVVTPGVDVISFLGIGDIVARWGRQLGLFEAQPLLLLPARVTRRKNIELAIEITAALGQQGLNPRLVVMGPLGPHNPANARYLDELRSLRRERGVEEAVIFLNEFGEVDDAARRDLYLIADALLFTSEREGFGIPVLEAGLARLPVFCSDIAPFRESALQWGHYFALDESPAVIAKRMVEHFGSDAGYQLKQRVVRQYAWPRIFQDHVEPLLKVQRPPLRGAFARPGAFSRPKRQARELRPKRRARGPAKARRN